MFSLRVFARQRNQSHRPKKVYAGRMKCLLFYYYSLLSTDEAQRSELDPSGTCGTLEYLGHSCGDDQGQISHSPGRAALLKPILESISDTPKIFIFLE